MMRAAVYAASGDRLLGHIEVPGDPICGFDFCERCHGDCMSCWDCGHDRIVYEDGLAEFLEEHDMPVTTWSPA